MSAFISMSAHFSTRNFFPHDDKIDSRRCLISKKIKTNLNCEGLLFALWFFLASSIESC